MYAWQQATNADLARHSGREPQFGLASMDAIETTHSLATCNLGLLEVSMRITTQEAANPSKDPPARPK